MIANNIFRAIGDFFVNVAFQPMDSIRSMDSWWLQNAFSWVLAIITMYSICILDGAIKKIQKRRT